MTITDLIKIYETKKKQYGLQAYRYISNVLQEAKEQHRRDFTGNDFEQSWKPTKGKGLEKLIKYIIVDEVRALGLEVLNGNSLERTLEKNLPEKLGQVKRNLLIDYGQFGYHLPDIDLIIYDPKNGKVVAIISSKVTLRERIAQTGYWKMKLQAQTLTNHIKVYFVTPDEDNDLSMMVPAKKSRAIVEVDTDGSYVLSETNIEESDKVKMFDKFIDDLKKLLE